eukprot:m.313845 g.313845  ORF g.313845 m.313845 type:complete len:227 (+) comp55414_c0_seq5:1476-2156(+)
MGGTPSLILKEPALFLGGDDSLDAFYTDNAIGAVLSICETPPPAHIPLQLTMHVDLDDEPSVHILPHLWPCVQFIHQARTNHINIYVHCVAGISRSSSVVCAYLMTHVGLSARAALRHITNARPAVSPNPGFRHQLNVYQQQERDEHFATLHSDPKTEQLLRNDWEYISNYDVNFVVETRQRQIFQVLMARKEEAGDRVGLVWLREQLEAEELASAEASDRSDAAE